MPTIVSRLAKIERDMAELAVKNAAEHATLCREYGALLNAETDADQDRLVSVMRLLHKTPADVKTDLEIIRKAAEMKRQLVGIDAALKETREAALASRDAADAAKAANQAARDAEGRRMGANHRYDMLLRQQADLGKLRGEHPELFPPAPPTTDPPATPTTDPPATPPAADPPTAGKKKIKRTRLAT